MKVRHTYGLYFSSFVHKIIRLRMLTQWPLLRRGTVVLLKFNEIWEREWYNFSCFKNSVAHVHLQIKTTLRQSNLFLSCRIFLTRYRCGAVVQWLSLLHKFIQLSLNSGSAQFQTLLSACRGFAMVRISDKAKRLSSVNHTTKTIHHHHHHLSRS